MLVIPAIDIRCGNSVRLKQGKIDTETIYSTDPIFIAKLWMAKGAQRIHVVDLDGAFGDSNVNKEIVKNICSVIDIPVEVGGGIRNIDKVKEIFDFGAAFVVLGTVAICNPGVVRKAIDKYGSDRIIVAIDAKDGKVAIDGWKDVTPINVLDLVNSLKEINVKNILYTDILRDGMFVGPDFTGLKKIFKNDIKIIVSGGIRTIDDLIRLKKYKKDGVVGAVVGTALYKDNFNLENAIKIVKES
ncbi:MAG: 1-(5-phosphoribosyl)-5-[(5-phosphoribosylamino)methylideneamino]imidazole-4-carboxamide isomerase [Endomicrobium sp.]|jgi:phosphoribosylformimino-5-aminoimidazole carboxamide ribotide isomerase|nr:1-(5-phosphoribosyl)-5-[(5-phosphoribosylamino)methylideneamino]imidazole-4-carboxamide isomerase [Endomicrobium sp.]